MRRLLPFLICALGFAQLSSAQSVTTNLIPTPPGDHNVVSGSIVNVKNNTEGDVTISIPYEPDMTLAPGESHSFSVTPSPGGSSHVDGPDGKWRFTATSKAGAQKR